MVDGELYCRTFFPKTFRQPSPPMHREMWDMLEDPRNPRVAFKVFRGGAKTTLARAYISKRIAYGISNTILIVGESQDQAKRSTRWPRRQIQYNRKWAQFYGLEKGDKFTDEWMEVRCTKNP